MATTTPRKRKAPLYKLILLGNPHVGKSNLLLRLNKDDFSDENSNTVGIEFVTKTMDIGEESVKAQIWDTAGQERFSSMMGTYYRKAKGALLLFSVTDEQSFEDAEGWRQQLSELGDEDCPSWQLVESLLLNYGRLVQSYAGNKTIHPGGVCAHSGLRQISGSYMLLDETR